MNEDVSFGSWLRQRRKELSITQEELAEQLGISWITLRKLESGERHPSGQIALLLADTLKVPSDEREAFVAFARTGRGISGATSPSAPWRSVLLGRSNLPTPLTPLVGREEVEAAILNQLLNPRTRLLTLTGAPGIGKTRLGLQVAVALLAHFEDGAYFVDLSPVADPDLVLPAIARTLGINETAQETLESVLLEYLRQRRMLLVLDNFEQVLDASTEVVRMMEASPWLKVLVTSREALEVRGERRFVVPPLALPDLNHLPAPHDLASYASVELFIERAQAIAPEFDLNEANALDVAALCVGLEGLPLAIELAASRAGQLSPAEMRVALTSRLKLLRTETRDLPARQRTLRSAIEWSYSLLASEEQTLFRRLGVFVGGFTSAAVDAICRNSVTESLAGLESESSIAATLEALQSLVAKSLLRKEISKRAEGGINSLGGTGRETRFGMLESISDYAREKLRESEVPWEARDAEMKHALYFMTLVEEAEPHLRGPGQQEWLGVLEDEHNNLRAALSWASAQSEEDGKRSDGRKTTGAAEIGLRIAAALRFFWFIHGYYREGKVHLETALAHSTSLEPSLEDPWSKTGEELQAARAEALAGAATLSSELGDYASGNALFHESLAIRRQINDSQGIASALNSLGVVAQDQGEYVSARAFHEESLAVWREVGNKHGTALALTNLGRAIFIQGEYERACSLHEESLALWREVGDKRGTALCLMNLGFVLYAQENYDEARALYHEAMAIQQEIGNKWGVATLLTELGNVSLMLNDYASARALHEQSLVAGREMGHKLNIAYSLHNLALLEFAQGAPEAARALLLESLAMQRGMNTKYVTAITLVGLGRVEATMLAGVQETLRGARLLGAAEALRERLDAVWAPEVRMMYERGVAAARDRLGEAAFERAILEGRALSIDQAVDYALAGSEARGS